MKQQKYYNFLQKQILLMIGLSLIPGVVYVIFAWVFDVLLLSLLWYIFIVVVSLYGYHLYKTFENTKMNEEQLKSWYKQLTIFMYIIFSSWSIIFVINVQNDEYNLHYIAIFTQLGASVVASALLVSDKKIFVPILLTLMLPLSFYFFFMGVWFGYVLSAFSLIFVSVLLYAAYNTNKLIVDNHYRAEHDSLTGLYNRRYFLEYMQSLSERVVEHNKMSHLFLIDLDHFKTINDSLGHDVGDKLLIQVSRRIEEYSENTHVVARLGDDEFIIVSKEKKPSLNMEELAYEFANGLLACIKEPYAIYHHHLYISASIGVHEVKNITSDANNFIKEVDIAMYEAKARGRNSVIFFDEALSEKVERHLLIEQKFYQALKENTLKMYYQPQFDSNQEMIGCEALVRWSDAELGVLSPSEFIPIAENTGLILELGSYVLKESLEVLGQWNKKGKFVQKFSINISIRQLLHEPFIKEVEVLTQNKIDMNQIIMFEITEHVFSEDIDKVISTMDRLKKSGISFSIDDFGTGYSSLGYLQELPIDEIKIDKSFVTEMMEGSNNQKMISTIISIAKNFKFKIVAEGVETLEQFEYLKNHDCDVFQGFYFDKALPKSEFEKKYLSI